jgi:ubiquinone/menaquinone biosynthesis C-methylase UbiE
MKEEKPDYGYVAWRYFAWMAVVGIIGLLLLVMGSLILLDFSLILEIMGATLALVGFWIAASYLLLYPGLFRGRSDRDFLSEVISSSLAGNEEVLDIGSGTGRVGIQFAKRVRKGRVVGIDIYEGVSGNSPVQAAQNAVIEGVGDRVTFQYGNVLDLPFADNSFDVVSMGSVLHELHSEEDKLKALKEIMRVLRPGGHLVIFELLQSPRMFALMLFFGFVWKTREYWLHLFTMAGLEKPSIVERTVVLKNATFVITKA